MARLQGVERAPFSRIKLNRETKNFSRHACNLRLMKTSLLTQSSNDCHTFLCGVITRAKGVRPQVTQRLYPMETPFCQGYITTSIPQCCRVLNCTSSELKIASSESRTRQNFHNFKCQCLELNLIAQGRTLLDVTALLFRIYKQIT